MDVRTGSIAALKISSLVSGAVNADKHIVMIYEAYKNNEGKEVSDSRIGYGMRLWGRNPDVSRKKITCLM